VVGPRGEGQGIDLNEGTQMQSEQLQLEDTGQQGDACHCGSQRRHGGKTVARSRISFQ
jgi:hypothetical protein